MRHVVLLGSGERVEALVREGGSREGIDVTDAGERAG
jgi:hypothetical protein